MSKLSPYSDVFCGRNRRPRIYAGLCARMPGGGALGVNSRRRVWFKQGLRRGRPSKAGRVAWAVVLGLIFAFVAYAVASAQNLSFSFEDAAKFTCAGFEAVTTKAVDSQTAKQARNYLLWESLISKNPPYSNHPDLADLLARTERAACQESKNANVPMMVIHHRLAVALFGH